MGINYSMAEAMQWNGLFEYLLVAHPDSDVNSEIIKEKEWFAGKYKQISAVKSQPHVTVANFLAREGMEPIIIRYMENVCRMQQAFRVSLKHYGGFPHHTIFLQVQNALPFQELAKQLKPVSEFIRASDCPPAKFIAKPHLTIARSLTQQLYNTAMADYACKIFDASFMLDEVVLLRRRHQFEACKTIQVFRLRPGGSTVLSDVA